MGWVRRLVPVLLLLSGHAALAQERVLNVYNWTDYIDPKVLERFTAETGIKVQYDVYDSLETLEGKLLAGKSGYDIVVPTAEPTFSRLIAAKALQPLDRSKIPNWSNLDPTLMQRVQVSDPGNRFGAIYLWGSVGLGEIPERIQALDPGAPMDSWTLLLKPEHAKKLAACGISVMDSAIDTIPTVLKYLGHSPESTDPKDLADVERTLMAVRPYIRTFASGGAIEALAGGQTCLVMTYSGDVIQAAVRAKEAGQKGVQYVAPKELAALTFDMLAVPADAPHPAEAMQFINFLLQPDVMAAITNQVRYPNAVPASRDGIVPEVRNNPNVYPDTNSPRFFTVRATPQAADRLRTRMWARFKAGH